MLKLSFEQNEEFEHVLTIYQYFQKKVRKIAYTIMNKLHERFKKYLKLTDHINQILGEKKQH